MRRHSPLIALLACVLFTSSCVAHEDVSSLQWRITARLVHDTQHYTQGLVLHDDSFVETSGLYGQSALMIKARDTGEVARLRRLPPQWFAEGATVWDGRIVMLTWREQIAQWFDPDLEPLAQMRYAGEGWGITHDDAHLITSNGSATLQFRRADDFAIVREIEVRDRGAAVSRLNELEYARGLVFANVWQTDRIAVIDPTNGKVRAWLELQALKNQFEKPARWNPIEHVLNGIAYDAARDRFYVTGKCWPVLFELEVEPLDPRR